MNFRVIPWLPPRVISQTNLRALRDFVLNPLRAILPGPLFRDHPCHSVATQDRASYSPSALSSTSSTFRPNHADAPTPTNSADTRVIFG